MWTTEICVRLYTAVTICEELGLEVHGNAADEQLGASTEKFAGGNDSGAMACSDKVVDERVAYISDSLPD